MASVISNWMGERQVDAVIQLAIDAEMLDH